jgi:hypothetical protein
VRRHPLRYAPLHRVSAALCAPSGLRLLRLGP